MRKLRPRVINAVAKLNEMLFGEHTYRNFVNFVGKGINYLDGGGYKTQFQFSVKKKKNLNEMYCLALLSNVLDVLYALLHLTGRKKSTGKVSSKCTF